MKNMKIHFKVIKYQIGVSMVEALVSLLIFTVGALGLAALQLSSLSAATDNEQRTLAVWKAQELVDRIKSNPGLEAAYIAQIGNDGAGSLGQDTDAGLFTCPAAAPVNCSSPGASCTDDQIVDRDLFEVFCDASSGVASTPDAANRIFGSSGFNQLEVILRRITEDNDGDNTPDGTGDIEMIFEWVSQEAERSDGIVNNGANGQAGASETVKTSVCASTDLTATNGGSDDRLDIDSRLDVYCTRFR